MSDARTRCIYCGGPARRTGKSEHIIPTAIGGAVTIRELSGRLVCERCNNGVLSEIDRELCSRSYLSAVASQVLGAKLWQAWDIDHESGGVLIEARPHWENGDLVRLACYPQIALLRGGPHLYGDAAEVAQFGFRDFAKLVTQSSVAAFKRFEHGQPRSLHVQRVQSDYLNQGFLYPPRVYVPKTIREVAGKALSQSFTIRYVDPGDRDRMLSMLSRGLDAFGFSGMRTRRSSSTPAFTLFFDVGEVVRCFVKIGLNLLAAYCERTDVGVEGFPYATGLVCGRTPFHPAMMGDNGFVDLSSIDLAAIPPGSHWFRLAYSGGVWHVLGIYFGGRIASYVNFPGPNREAWRTLEVTAPIGSKGWTHAKSAILRPLRPRVEWKDASRYAPCLKLQSSAAAMRTERVATRRREAKG